MFWGGISGIWTMADVTVIGGGLTGLMTAIALSHAGPRIHLVDRTGQDAAPPDERTTTINAAGARMMQALGVWDRMASAPAKVMRVAVAEGPAPTGLAARRRRDSDLSWQGGDRPMGYVVGNAALQDALRTILGTREVSEHRGRAVTGWHADADGAVLTLADAGGTGVSLHTSLAVACDGARSVMADLAGLARREERQTQTAIVTTLRTERRHEDTAYQRFLPGGPFALMPGPGETGGHEMSLVWTLPNATAQELIAAEPAAFEAACFEAFGSRLGYMSARRHPAGLASAALMAAADHGPGPCSGRRCGACHPPACRAGIQPCPCRRRGAGRPSGSLHPPRAEPVASVTSQGV